MCCEYVCAVLCVDVRSNVSMCVNLPLGLYLGATQKVKRGSHTGRPGKDRQGARWRGNKGQPTLTNVNALANLNRPLYPASHTLIVTLRKRVAFWRRASLPNASNRHPTHHSTLLLPSCTSNGTNCKSEISSQSFIRIFELQRSYTL